MSEVPLYHISRCSLSRSAAASTFPINNKNIYYLSIITKVGQFGGWYYSQTARPLLSIKSHTIIKVGQFGGWYYFEAARPLLSLSSHTMIKVGQYGGCYHSIPAAFHQASAHTACCDGVSCPLLAENALLFSKGPPL